ncbi:hypothetical protein NQ314_005786 [Rhamnusium bicolor]|uniref:Uncharacterized protein n=1 Tax=Rhamnusium bicolor TaxID=1586634 RepID=A0AAV8ZD11_9CUCU|nr:hypothetical protein NQ314_005786 [Rhamnusium bicolor]
MPTNVHCGMKDAYCMSSAWTCSYFTATPNKLILGWPNMKHFWLMKTWVTHWIQWKPSLRSMKTLKNL